MSCPCDVRIHPAPLAIPAGLPSLPRQIAGFPEFRDAMLAEIPGRAELAGWRARDGRDLGVMLLEMWAYVCDALAFYDQVLADEAYLRTAKRRLSLHRLTTLLGYIPRPAVAATVRLALLTEGRQPVLVPAGTALRSGAFGKEPPQVFELDSDVVIHPILNAHPLLPPKSTTLSGTIDYFLLDPATVHLQADSPVLALFRGPSPAEEHLRTVTAIERTVLDGVRYVRAALDTPIHLAGAHAVADVRLETPTQMASLWSRPFVSGDLPALMDYADYWLYVTLDVRRDDIQKNHRFLLSKGQEYRWFTVFMSGPWDQTYSASTEVFGYKIPAVKTPVTAIACTTLLNTNKPEGAADWYPPDAFEIRIHFRMIDAGRVVLPDRKIVEPSDPLLVQGLQLGPSGPPTPAPTAFLLRDRDDRGIEIQGTLDFEPPKLTPAAETTWSPPLALPVTVFGNVVEASRGERVAREILGSGNGSVANQSFTLKKSPLTYLPSPAAENESGVASTLSVHVSGVLWDEVPTFYGAGPEAQVYIIRQDEQGRSRVLFGDGIRGARLPTGAGNVVASYRFGAGAASPPAGSLTNLARPLKGLKGAANPVAAGGGADAETPEDLRELAPRSALLLGRAVSIQDIEALALAAPGVRAARAEWRWDGARQRAVAKIWYIGAVDEETLTARVRAMTDPSTPIDVAPAVAVPVTAHLNVETDPRRNSKDVCAALHNALLDLKTGLLAPERIGIGTPLYRSRIFEACLAIPGVTAVRSILWRSGQAPPAPTPLPLLLFLFLPFASYAKTPGAGHYFDFEAGALEVSGIAGSA